MEGYHSSVFVYGQTGTGKTYTMQVLYNHPCWCKPTLYCTHPSLTHSSSFSSQGGTGEPGIVQLSVNEIFSHITCHPEMEFLLRFSYLEIYNERIYDLLAAGAKSEVKIFEVARTTATGASSTSGAKDVIIKGLREEIVVTMEHVLSLVEVGNLHRHMAMTESNDQSSRSHVIFRMVIESQPKRSPRDRAPTSVGPIRSATLNLIDLAGSESVRLANTTGQHLEEGKYINRSLLTLGHIIWKLSRERQSGKHQVPPPSSASSSSAAPSLAHLPYRNSKLTRILQPSLGGQAQIAVICTIAPSVECLAETHNTLKFASRARRLRNRAAVNEISGESVLLRKYRARIRELEEQLESLQRRKSSVGVSGRNAGGGNTGNGAQASVNLSIIEERQMELQFAINNINRVILNSGAQQQVAEAASAMVTPAPLPPPSTQLRGRPRPAEIKTQTEPVRASETPDDANDEPDEEEDEEEDEAPSSRSNSNRTLIGSGGSRASTKTLPLSSSSSLPTTDGGDYEPKDMIIGEEPEDEEQADLASGQPSPAQQQLQPPQQRMSLTTMLRSKYQDEITRMEQRAGRWSLRPDGEVQPQQALLQEFVRGLEIAEAEQETRMSKIQELELANRQLRQVLASREEELVALKNTRPENETL